MIDRSGAGEIGTALVDGASALVRVAAKNPLKLVVVRERGSCVRVNASTFGGGLLAGDRVAIDLDVGVGSSLVFGTTAPGKVYRSDDGRTSTQELRVRVAAAATCAITPPPVTCFAEARYDQRTTIDAHAEANIIVLELIAAGRTARGERWAFDALASRLQLRIGGELRLNEAIRLEAGAATIAERLRNFEAIGTVVLAGPRLADAIAAIRAQVQESALGRDVAVRLAASPQPWGLVVRGAGLSVESLELKLEELLAPALAIAGGADPWHGPW